MTNEMYDLVLSYYEDLQSRWKNTFEETKRTNDMHFWLDSFNN